MAPITRIKIVAIGDRCGKTCLIMTYINGRIPNPIPVLYDTSIIDREVDGQWVEVEIWDTVSQEDYERFRPRMYPGTHVILMCFSVESTETFQNISKKYTPEVNSHVPKDLPIILVGNKKELREDEFLRDSDLVKTEDANALAEEIGAVDYIECSAKEDDGVTTVFDTALKVHRQEKHHNP